jgi:RNA polymerase sigma-70 factor (ECF subfamily)
MITTQSFPHPGSGTETLFRSHAPYVERLLYRLGVSASDLDDVAQEVFLVVHRTGGFVPGRASKATYLTAIAVRAAASWRRRERRLQARRADLAPDLPASDRSPLEAAEVSESVRRLQAALDHLAPDLRATLVLVDLEGATCGEVAAAMQVPLGTVYWRLHRARSLFRKAVEAMSSDPPRPESVGLLALPWAATPRWFRRVTARALAGAAIACGAAAASLVVGAFGADAARGGTRTDSGERAMAAAVATPAPAPVHRPADESPRVEVAPAVALVAAGIEVTAPVGKTPRRTRAALAQAPESAPAPQSAPESTPAPRSESESASESAPARPPDDLAEMQQIALAGRLLSRDPARALALADDCQRRFPHGYMGTERRYVRIMALFALGRRAEASDEAARFLREVPDGNFSRRIRAALR